jgi:hypothetical protein
MRFLYIVIIFLSGQNIPSGLIGILFLGKKKIKVKKPGFKVYFLICFQINEFCLL